MVKLLADSIANLTSFCQFPLSGTSIDCQVTG